MDYNEFEIKFIEKCRDNKIEVRNVKKFYDYMKIILNWNEKINLTAIKNEEEFLVKHFIDSLAISEFVESDSKIIDVGTGAGFPGIPLKLFHEKQFVTLLDSVNKKVNVLNDVINKLKLEKIEAIHGRAEELGQNEKYREKYDVAVSRAVSNMSTLVEYLIPFVKIGGIIICMKGPNVDEELQSSLKAINVLGGTIEKVETIFIDGEHERNIVIIKKINNTPKKYPRGQGKPLKEPIK